MILRQGARGAVVGRVDVLDWPFKGTGIWVLKTHSMGYRIILEL